MTMRRRDAIKTIGGAMGAAALARVLPGCETNDSAPKGITTYVYLMMENRSYDHFFGSRAFLENMGGDGPAMTASNLDLNGQPVTLFKPALDKMCDPDPPHGWDELHASWNNGACDGFVKQHQMQHPGAIDPMQYLTRSDVPVTWALADQYATADRWFCAVMGPTWPNRFYWHSGSSGGLKSNQLPAGGSLTWPSIYHRLDAKGVDWAYYYSSIPVVPLFASLDVDRHVRRFRDFLDEAAAGKLPPVVYLDPAFNGNDDHPPVHPIHGQELIASVYTALAQSPQWKNCLLVVTYDEHGGFFDHVSPPKTTDERAADDFDQLGFRVPTLVAGPYVKQGHVSSVIHEHCSALRELEVAFDLEPLNQRTQSANDLSDFIDADRLARGEWAPPIEIPSVDPTQWPMPALCTSGGLRSAGASHPILEWADAHPEAVAGYDLRPELPQYRRAIRDFLAARRSVSVK